MKNYYAIKDNEAMSSVLEKFHYIMNANHDSILYTRINEEKYELRYDLYILIIELIVNPKNNYNKTIHATLKIKDFGGDAVSEVVILTLDEFNNTDYATDALNDCEQRICWMFDKLDTEFGVNNSKKAISRLLLLPIKEDN